LKVRPSGSWAPATWGRDRDHLRRHRPGRAAQGAHARGGRQRALTQIAECLGPRHRALEPHGIGEEGRPLAHQDRGPTSPRWRRRRSSVEAVREDLALKSSIFQELDRACPPEDILATNTSAPVGDGDRGPHARPDRVIGLHFLQPVPRVPLVEVVRGLATSDRDVPVGLEFVRLIGKTGSRSSSTGLHHHARDPALPERGHVRGHGGRGHGGGGGHVDEARLRPAGGPAGLADQMGLDEVMRWMQHLFTELGDVKYRPCPLLRKMIRAGRLA
jgi:hypothetical protein